MKKGSVNAVLLLALLAVTALVTQISFAQATPPQCYYLAGVTVCDSNIEDVKTQPGGTGTGTIYMNVRVGGVIIPVNQNGSCVANLVGPSGGNTGGCARDQIRNAALGNYSVSWLTGWPQGADTTKNPIVSGPQTLAANGAVTFNIDFTAVGGALPPSSYLLSCQSVGNNAIKVSWTGEPTGSQRLTLYGGDTIMDVIDQVGSNQLIYEYTGTGPGPGSYTEGGLGQSVQRWYALVMNESLTGTVWSGPVTCTTGTTTPPPPDGPTPTTDKPTDLDVKAVSQNILNLTWKDNVSSNRDHRFEIERIKATPQPSTEFKGVLGTAASNSFSWKNNTGYAPYNSILERSISQNVLTRFSSNDPFASLVSNEYDSYANGNVTGAGWPKSFTYTDSGLAEATVYYYRLKTCFPDAITSLYPPVKTGETANPRPDNACSGYAPGATSVFTTTTLPNAPSDLTASALSPTSVRLTWKDNSAKELGFLIHRNGVVVDTLVNPSTGIGGTVTFLDSGLSSGTKYDYTVSSFVNNPIGSGRIYSEGSGIRSATTWTTLTVVANPTNLGGIVGVGIDCGNGKTACSNNFEKGHPMALTANPAGGGNFVNWTGDVCNNSINVYCSFFMDKDVAVTANFAPSAPQFETVTVKGFLNGVQQTMTFNFSLNAPGGTSVVSGTNGTQVTFTNSADYPVGVDNRFNFSYVSGGPSGAVFDRIEWDNFAGGSGRPLSGLMTTSGGFIGIQGGTLEYRVYLNQPLGAGSGDANGDGVVTCADVNMINQAISGDIILTPDKKLRADVSGNGTVSAYDVSLLLQRKNLSCPAAVSENPWYGSIYNAAESAVSEWWDGMMVTFRDGWDAVAELLKSSEVKEAQAVSGGVYGNYFGLTKLSAGLSSRLLDTGLSENTVYLYRVRAVYTDGGTPSTSDWSDKVAGKTLGASVPPPDDGGVPVIYSNSTMNGSVGQAFSYAILASNNPTSYGASGLPRGLSVNSSTGLITGTPSAVGSSDVTLSATNTKGTGNKLLRITIITGGGVPPGGLPPGQTNPGICAANNLCDFSNPTTQIFSGTGVLLEQSEAQCLTNSNCANVGRYSKTTEEK